MYIIDPDLSGPFWRLYWLVMLFIGVAWLMSRFERIPFLWSVFHMAVVFGAGALLGTVAQHSLAGALVLFLFGGLYWFWIMPRLPRRTRELSGKRSE